MQKAILKKLLFVIVALQCFIPFYTYSQCLGPNTTGTYSGGKQPSTSSNYFVNHVFSTFNDTSTGVLNLNTFTIKTNGPTTNSIATISPAETPVTGTGFPSPAPQSQMVSTSIVGRKVTHTFTSNLAIGTHVYLQDVDRQEGWSIVFKDASGVPIDSSNFTPFNLSTQNFPTFTATSTSLSFKSILNQDKGEPLVGIIIKSSLVRSIEFTVTTVATQSSNTEFFYSVPLMPSFTATASNNGPLCSGNTLTLAGGTSTLDSHVPTPIYLWSGPNSYSNTTTSSTSSISSVTTAATGTYSLTVKDTFGCFTTPTVTTSVIINQSPTVTTANTASICSGNSTNISLTANLASTFTWTIGTITGGITGASAGSGSTINQMLTNPSNSTAGTVQYLVTPTSTSTSCTGSTYTITVTVNPLPAVTTANTKSICSGSGTNISLTASATSTFTWTIGTITGGITGASAGSGSTINQTLTNPSNSTAGTVQYLVTPISTTGSCSGVMYTITVTVNPIPTITTANTKSICSGSGTNMSLTASATSTFTWTIGTITGGITGASAGSGSTINQTLTNPSNSTAGTVQYLVTPTSTTSSCAGAAYSITVTVNVASSISLSNNSPVNYGNTINLSATISGGSTPYTIAWTGPNSFSSSTQNPSISSVSSANAGLYILKVTGSNGCSASTKTYVAVKSGWIYIHKKNINEESSTNFTFTLSDNSGNLLKTFYTNDSAGNTLNVYDIGAGHDDGAGMLWAVAGTTYNAGSGSVYYRSAGSTNWYPTTVTNATAIDGAALNQFVYVNSSGDGYFYNAGTSTLIFNHNTSHNGQTATASDIAYGGGQIAIRNSNGRVYKYTGDFTNDSWTDISNNSNIADRIDMSSDGTMIVYILSATVKTYTISTGTTTTLPVFTTTSGAGASGTSSRDIAIDDNGTIYASGTSGNTTCCGNTDIVFSYPLGASAWTAEPEARIINGRKLTGGPGGQAWESVDLGSTFPETIYTRVTDNTGTHIWLDDERVKNSSSLYGNSIMMEVDAGTYKVVETLPNSTTYDLGRYNLYDPTGNTTGNVNNNTTTIRPAYSEAVNVEYINEKLNPKLIDNGNCTTNILQSFDAGTGTGQFGTATFGTPVEGTVYHYFNQTNPQDGYYFLVKTINGNWFHNTNLTDHTGNAGYFYMVNASYAKDEFYRQRITGLTASLTYRIGFWAANASPPSPIKPKIRFGMQTLQGVIFGDSTTPEICCDSAWHFYSVSFTVPSGVTTADLFLRNENIGGSGNDLAIDDISINPIPTPLTNNVISPVPNLCVGSTYAITNSVAGGTWSTSNPSIVTVDTSLGTITVLSAGSANLTYTYINNAYCKSIASSNVSVTVPPAVAISSASADVCKNGTTILNANASSGTLPYSYAWSGTGGSLSSTITANPTLTAPSTVGTYNYSVTVTDNMGCISPTSTTTVFVHAPVPNIYLSCAASASPPYAQLTEVGGVSGDSRLWSSTTNNVLFYSSSSLNNGSGTSTLQAPYINQPAKYTVILTDSYGCQDSSSIMFGYSMCGLLPISMMNFTAIKKEDKVALNWNTYSETGSKYFSVERSSDEKNWFSIGYVGAAGNSNTIRNYSFADLRPLSGMNYYRLEQVDVDGKNAYSKIVFINFDKASSIKLYPNPAKDFIIVDALNLNTQNVISIIDMQGKVLKRILATRASYELNIAFLSKGVYIMKIETNKRVNAKKFVKD